MSTSLALDRGRTAAATRRWQDAFRALEIADAESALALTTSNLLRWRRT